MIPLNLGMRGHDLVADSPAQLAAKLNQYGLTNVQLAVKKSFPELVPDCGGLTHGAASYIGTALAAQGIQLSVLGCYVNIASEDDAVRTQAVQDFKTHLRLCRGFGATMVGTETGSVRGGYCVENFTEEAYATVRDSVVSMVQYAEEQGALVGIEAGLHNPIHTAARLKRLLGDVRSDKLVVILDCVNLLTPDNIDRQNEVMEQAFELLGDRVEHLHLKDCLAENGKLRVVPVGTGIVDHAPILKFAKSCKPLITVTLESTEEKDLPLAIEHVMQVYNSV